MNNSNKHSASLCMLEQVLQKDNIVIDHVGSISISKATEGNHVSLPLGKYAQINISVFVPISD